MFKKPIPDLLGGLRPRGLQCGLGLPGLAPQPRLKLALLPAQLRLVAGIALLRTEMLISSTGLLPEMWLTPSQSMGTQSG